MVGARTKAVGWVTVLSALLIVTAPHRLLAEGKSRSATPDTLLEMACAAELAGQEALRDALVEQVLTRDPENEKARWLAGQVRDGEGWGTAAEVERSRAGDERLQEYVERRDGCGDDFASRLKLANWCRDHEMPDREKAHLNEIVAWHGADPSVMSRLGMVKFHNRWVAKDDLDEFRRLDDRQRRVERKWKPIFADWKDDLKSGDSSAYERLTEDLQEITEGEALPVLEEVISTYSEQAALAVVERLDTLQEQEATESLVRHAVFSDFDAARIAASEALKKRPKYNYVPMLLNGLVAPLEVTIDLPHGGTNYVRRTVTQRGMDHDELLVDHFMQYGIAVAFGRRPTATTLAPRLPAGLRPGSYVVEATDGAIRRNERVRAVLYSVTGQSYNEPEEWWDWWNRYTDTESDEEKPTVQRHRYRRTWSIVPAHCSCLAWGTRIATETGTRPIEKIWPGDKVLAQDPNTGQLEYKAVLEHTVERLKMMREISFGDDSVTVTPGHQFWVVAEGWRMAKELEVGQRLHCLEGSREITAIEERSDAAAYNLVVDDFSTYFAGDSRVLLHDYTFPQPTSAVLPGYVPEIGRY